MRHLLALTLSCVLVLGGVLASAAPALAYTPDNEELTFLALINDYRGQQGLTALSINSALGDAAEARSRDMAEGGYFDHTAPDGTTFDRVIERKGYTGGTVGENIAAGMETAAEVMVVWQNSPEHNAGMLNPAFTEIGIGRVYVEGSQYGWYWTTNFGGGALPSGATQNNADGERNRNGSQTDTVIAEPTSSITTDDGAATTGDPATNVSEYDGEVVQTSQEAPGSTLNADGSNVSANDDGSGPTVGNGEVTTFPDINTGGVQGDNVNYDQSVTPPSTSTTAPPAEQAPPPAEQAAAPVEQAAAPVETTTTTTTQGNGTVTDTYTENIQEGEGNARTLGNTSTADASSLSGTVTSTDGTITENPEPVVVNETTTPDPAAAPVTTEPAPVDMSGVDPALAGTGCANYGTWMDAQVAYENGGGLAADPAFINSLDPNWDGVACEELMAYS